MAVGTRGEVSTREGWVSPHLARAGDTGVTVGALQCEAVQPILTYIPFPVGIAIYCRNGQYEEKVRFL